MKLDQDCVRDLLLKMEEHLTMNEQEHLSDFHQQYLSDTYTFEQVLYTAARLYEARFIKGHPIEFDAGLYDIVLETITYEGHQMLDNIRDPEVWQDTKNVTAKVAGASLSVLTEVAKTMVLKKLGF